MSSSSDNETWLIESGDVIIRKEASVGITGLSPWERLVYSVWVADYGMRNAGDLQTAQDLYAEFQSEAQHFSRELSLPFTLEAFSLTVRDLEREYFDRFEAFCVELRNAPARS